MRAVVMGIILAGLASPAVATTLINGKVDAVAFVGLGNATDSFTTGPSSTAVPATVQSVGLASVSSGNYQASASVTATGIWTSADAGTIDIQWGWTSTSAGSGLLTQLATNFAIPNWSYTFTATGDGSFDGRYTVTGSGATFGLQPIYGSDDLPFGPYGGDVADPTGAGSFSVALVNGLTYTMALYNFGNLTSQEGIDTSGSARALIDWTITYDVLPEPATWAMLITGFGMVGGAVRRRRVVAAA